MCGRLSHLPQRGRTDRPGQPRAPRAGRAGHPHRSPSTRPHRHTRHAEVRGQGVPRPDRSPSPRRTARPARGRGALRHVLVQRRREPAVRHPAVHPPRPSRSRRRDAEQHECVGPTCRTFCCRHGVNQLVPDLSGKAGPGRPGRTRNATETSSSAKPSAPIGISPMRGTSVCCARSTPAPQRNCGAILHWPAEPRRLHGLPGFRSSRSDRTSKSTLDPHATTPASETAPLWPRIDLVAIRFCASATLERLRPAELAVS